MVKSFNEKSNFNKETRVLIVGTLTSPEGMAHGYFYSSSHNPLYSKLSKMFDRGVEETKTFAYLKKKLICETDPSIKDQTIDAINLKLENLGIAFFDVVKYADRKDKPYSPSDDDLHDIEYDKDTYLSRKGDLMAIIFSSKRSQEMFEKNIDDSFEGEKIVINLSRKKDNCGDVIKAIKPYIAFR